MGTGTSDRTNSNYRPGYNIQGNWFLLNHCEQKGVIDIRRDSKLLSIDGNVFSKNRGVNVLIEGTVSFAPCRIGFNMFEDSSSPSGGVLEILRIERDLTIANNTFIGNEAQNVVFLQVVESINPNMAKKILQFANNTLESNKPFVNKRPKQECAVSLSGTFRFKVLELHYNKLNNKKFKTEVCLAFPVTTHKSEVDITLNWWGTREESVVRERIVDFDDNYDYPAARYAPFIVKEYDFDALSDSKEKLPVPSKILSGRLFESLTLTVEKSPYLVKTDLTVLPNVTLTVEPGVEVRVAERRSILVLGTLIAKGTTERKINFKAVESVPLTSRIIVRLTDGSFPWQGRLETFYNKTWMPVCEEKGKGFDSKNADVICKQLGYKGSSAQKPKNPVIELSQGNSKPTWPFLVNCYGNESTIDKCQLIPISEGCKSNHWVRLSCNERTWGGLQFTSKSEDIPFQRQSVLENVEIIHCGKRHETEVAGIETVLSVPKLKFVSVKNCSSGGLTVFSPEDDFLVVESTFSNTGRIGVSFVKSQVRAILDRAVASHNTHGVVFAPPNIENVPNLFNGRVNLCSSFKEIKLGSKALLYFGIPSLKPTSANENCRRTLTVSQDRGVKLTLLYYQGDQRIQVYLDARGSPQVNKGKSRYYDEMKVFLGKPVYAPRQTVALHWSGSVHSKIMIQAESYKRNG